MFSWLEKNPFFFAVAVFIVIAYAGIIEILPDFANRARPLEGIKPPTVLELAGKHIYMKDSCNACHTQMIRPFKSETDRYGMYSLSGEYAYDRPHLWGSKRTGPDLKRVGNYRTTDWHENHMLEPASVVPGSLMPAYKHMFKNNADIETAYGEALTTKKVFNVPYDMEGMPKLGTWEETQAIVKEQAQMIVDEMKNQEVKDAFARGEIREIVAIIAYLNSLK
ncbi:cytochrome-c oxidase, cbb3-type subunit II [Campylobacter sp. RM16192]|uniref:cytochrome-c oxidase, cbb3-type subunit II n=1 Tax=Campylobacter sp. RM16192 TaxID=1660080 RepID=UPI0014518E9C|nr:cytochrome-c oxidase, cbb3-type subunit II [Campylobacter sp. RM16192]QCD51918.1 cytochrome c oxidase CcoNOPQ, cbb3-type, membrane-bound monoheme cytochrome c subunit II [Campylobacter sp. RM16192]